ncbi:Pectin lyase-like protein [Glarea lozoyensis ATCC 20868]|uniref:pectate lyase n=2 Tax=Glarea lozoyensis TaxID=101852 RepID=S3CX82_GLAL2|nr:Pectin lyase-like protein [Glarea lozoyensis ATCC 20868]EHL01531.1 putative pectate lyase A [Glarea lozoyensis 74030]EPE24431.1 Pectin lyase-like protein [Glarea lozoyensis ATCC 20868]
MKFSTVLSSSLMVVAALAAPTPTVQEPVNAAFEKRASVTDTPVGYASQNGGTTGGAGGTTTTVSSFAEFTAAVSSSDKKVVYVSGPITQAAKQVKVGSNTSIIGKDSSVVFTGFGLIVKGMSNVVIRNIAIAKVLAANGDAIGVQKSTNVWIDHVDVSSDRDHDKDFYDGLLDLTHAADFVTISNSFVHDHWKASLVGHSDSNGAEDKGHLRVTYANNLFENLNSRGPSFRFGTGHMFNNYYNSVSDGINTRQGAQVLVENNVFVDSKKSVYSTDGGFAVATGNDFGSGSNTAPAGTLKTVPYSYTKLDASAVKAAVVGTAGVTLKF